jgi:outer membrane lipoprotein SlyB
MKKFLIVLTLSGLVLGGCANKTESGALVGAGGGALVGGLVGGWEGAAIGAGAGAIGGAVVGNLIDSDDAKKQKQQSGAGSTPPAQTPPAQTPPSNP